VNQAYAQVFVAASSVAIAMWSGSILRSRLARGLGIYGCILGLVTLFALFSGRLSLDAPDLALSSSVKQVGSSLRAHCFGDARTKLPPSEAGMLNGICGSADSCGTRRILLKESFRLLRGLLH
jgi:hypothetical protein